MHKYKTFWIWIRNTRQPKTAFDYCSLGISLTVNCRVNPGPRWQYSKVTLISTLESNIAPAPFPLLVYLENICLLCILAMSWKQYACASIDHLYVSHRLSLNMTHSGKKWPIFLTYQLDKSCIRTKCWYFTRHAITCCSINQHAKCSSAL